MNRQNVISQSKVFESQEACINMPKFKGGNNYSYFQGHDKAEEEKICELKGNFDKIDS